MTVPANGVGVSDWLSRALTAPETVPDTAWVTLLGLDGDELEVLCLAADQRRADQVGDAITYAVNRNLDPALMAEDPALLAELVAEAWELGATEICMQGTLPAHLPGRAYLDLIAGVHAAEPRIHLHAFRPAELDDAAERLEEPLERFLRDAREAGLGSVPGTGARILDDHVRAALTGGADIPVATWTAVIAAAHRAGLRSTATMVYGHIETPAQQIAHLRTLAAMQAATGGFTELILMPIQPDQVPVEIENEVRFPSERETRALHAVARLLLAGQIDHLQAAWPKLGLATAQRLLAGGADDVGGILLDGQLRPDAGPEAGNSVTVDDLRAVAHALDRPLAQRTTLYGEVPG